MYLNNFTNMKRLSCLEVNRIGLKDKTEIKHKSKWKRLSVNKDKATGVNRFLL